MRVTGRVVETVPEIDTATQLCSAVSEKAEDKRLPMLLCSSGSFSFWVFPLFLCVLWCTLPTRSSSFPFPLSLRFFVALIVTYFNFQAMYSMLGIGEGTDPICLSVSLSPPFSFNTIHRKKNPKHGENRPFLSPFPFPFPYNFPYSVCFLVLTSPFFSTYVPLCSALCSVSPAVPLQRSPYAA